MKKYIYKLLLKCKRLIMTVAFYILKPVATQNRGTHVLCYHSFDNPLYRFSVDTDIFKTHIHALSKSFDFVSLQQALETDQSIGAKQRVVLTFDDGFASIMEIAPILEKNGIPGTIFALALPNSANRTQLNTDEQLLSYDDLRVLHKRGWTIGCHSATHQNLSTLNISELKAEIIDSKKLLEQQIGIPIKYFAYPKGIATDSAQNIVREAGFEAAFGIHPGTITRTHNVMNLPRTIIEQSHKSQDLRVVLSNTSYAIRRITDKFNIWERINQ